MESISKISGLIETGMRPQHSTPAPANRAIMESIRWELPQPLPQPKLMLIPKTARDLTLEAARDVGPRRSTKPLPAAQIKKMLDSRNEKDVLDGLRRVVAVRTPCYAMLKRHVYIWINVDFAVDAILQSSTADLDLLSCCSEDSVMAISFYETTGIQLLDTPCRG